MYLDIIIHMLYYMYRYKEESVCIVSSLQDNIRKKLNLGKEEGSTKQISLTLNEQTLNKVDAIVEQFKKLTGGKGDIPSSRNQLIEDAIEEYISAAVDVLLNDYLVNIEEAMGVVEVDDEELADKPDSVQQAMLVLRKCSSGKINGIRIVLLIGVFHILNISLVTVARRIAL